MKVYSVEMSVDVVMFKLINVNTAEVKSHSGY